MREPAKRALRAHGLGWARPFWENCGTVFFYSATRQFNEALLKQHVGHFAIWPFDHVAAIEYGRLAAELRRSGRTMQQIDIQIAAIASMPCRLRRGFQGY